MSKDLTPSQLQETKFLLVKESLEKALDAAHELVGLVRANPTNVRLGVTQACIQLHRVLTDAEVSVQQIELHLTEISGKQP